MSLSYNLNIFNGKLFDDSLRSSSDQLFGISGGDVYQLQGQNKLTVIRRF